MVIILQIVYTLCACVQGALKQGQKGEHSKHNDKNFLRKSKNVSLVMLAPRFVFLTAAFSFPLQHAKNF